jgi:hypothetical protein
MIPLLAASALAGPWTRPLGGYYAKLGADLYVAPQYVSPVAVVPGATASGVEGFRGEQLTAYAEVGLVDPDDWRGQLALAVPLTIGHTEFAYDDAFGEVRGHTTVVRAGDVRLTPQVALHRTAPVAAALEIKVPAYRNDGVCRDHPYRVFCPRPGDGQVDLTPLALAGSSREAWFGELSAGWKVRTDLVLGAEGPVAPLGDGPVWTAAGGWTPGDLVLIARFEGNHVLGDDRLTPQVVRAGPTALYTFARKAGLAIEARFAADMWAKGASRGVGGGVGLSARR